MTTEGVTSGFANGKTFDPYFDLSLDPDLAKNEWPAALTAAQAVADGEHRSLMAKAVTQEMWKKYKDVKTSSGWTMARAINSGCLYPSSFMGCHAGDEESYKTFQDLFDQVITAYHVGYDVVNGEHITDMSVEKITEDLEEAATSKVISTRIRVARNLIGFPLNPGGTKETRMDVTEVMEKVFAKMEGDLKGTFYRHTTMTPEQQQDLIDKHYLFRGKDKMQAASGYHEHWPHGRGIFVSEDEKFLVWVNEGDHLRLISMEKGANVKSVFGRLSRAQNAIEENLKTIQGKDKVFMCDPVRGMLTCCPTNLGTGMRGSVHILVPKLIAKIGFEKIDEIARNLNCQARGSTGEHSEVIDRIDISNWRRLGFSESSLVQDMIKCANILAKMEEEA